MLKIIENEFIKNVCGKTHKIGKEFQGIRKLGNFFTNFAVLPVSKDEISRNKDAFQNKKKKDKGFENEFTLYPSASKNQKFGLIKARQRVAFIIKNVENG